MRGLAEYLNAKIRGPVFDLKDMIRSLVSEGQHMRSCIRKTRCEDLYLKDKIRGLVSEGQDVRSCTEMDEVHFIELLFINRTQLPVTFN